MSCGHDHPLQSSESEQNLSDRKQFSFADGLDANAGVIIVDHGSRRDESNRRLLDFVELFRARQAFSIVEPAHMELAAPTIEDAFRACCDRGAKSIIISPFFLLPGRHWQSDIPQLAAEASAACNQVPYIVTSPLGVHDGLVDVMLQRMHDCIYSGSEQSCQQCDDSKRCLWPESVAKPGG